MGPSAKTARERAKLVVVTLQGKAKRVLIRIANTPRPYAWGSPTAIAELLGREPAGGPEAELWLGSHPGSPARIVAGADEEDLAQWAAAHAPEGRLPFLLKVLAASAPLSLQVHPTLEQAREGFARENALGIPLDAAERNYKDPFPKPELMLALSDPFRALCGFRPVAESRADLQSLGDSRLDPLLDRLVDDAALPAVVAWLLERRDGVDEVVQALSEHASGLDGDECGAWLGSVRMLVEHHHADPGIAISTLLHTVLLRPGEALYLPAGNIHAYLEGVGIELMAASDNVLRGGLTAKHVDVAELLRVLDARPMPAPYLQAEHPAPGISVLRPAEVDFALVDVEVSPGEERRIPSAPRAVVLCLEGEIEIDGRPLRRGEAAVILKRHPVVAGDGRCVIATVV